MKKKSHYFALFIIKSSIILIITYIWLFLWWNQYIFDLLFKLSPNSNNYFTKYINNKDFYCENDKLVLTDTKNDIDDTTYSVRDDFYKVTNNEINKFVTDNNLFCKWDKLYIWRVMWMVEWYCKENEWIEIKQSKPENPCY